MAVHTSKNVSTFNAIARQSAIGVMALVATTATLLTAESASAQVTRQQYDKQYENAPSDLLRLDFDAWTQFNDLVNEERNSLDTLNLPQADLSKLRWSGGVQDVEVFFINEGAGYRNQLFYSVDSGTTKNKIFDDISSPLSIVSNSKGPLKLGEGASLGNFAGNTFIDFFVKSNGKNGGQQFLGFDPNLNSDNLTHVLGYTVGDYLLLGFEDIVGGGDEDYNDVVFAVKGVTTSVPEPSLILGLLGASSLMMIRKRHAQSEA